MAQAVLEPGGDAVRGTLYYARARGRRARLVLELRGKKFGSSHTVVELEGSGSREFEVRLPCTEEDVVLLGFTGAGGITLRKLVKALGASQLLVVGEAWRWVEVKLKLEIDVPLTRNPSDEVVLKVVCAPA